MKVRCIKDFGKGWRSLKKAKFFWNKDKYIYENGPKKNDIVTVKGEYWSKGEKWYKLVEWPYEESGAFTARHFIPIEEQYEKVTFENIKEKISAN